jgi:hypothetical protein
MRILCKTCLAVTDLPPGADPHAYTWCECCTVTDESGKPHHHGRDVLSAEECETANHPGKRCWHPPAQPDKPDGCTICRPVMHLPVAGVVLAAGG